MKVQATKSNESTGAQGRRDRFRHIEQTAQRGQEIGMARQQDVAACNASTLNTMHGRRRRAEELTINRIGVANMLTTSGARETYLRYTCTHSHALK